MTYHFGQNVLLQQKEIDEIPEYPVYNGTDAPNEYLLKLDAYKKKANKQRVEQLIYFINRWLKREFKSLIQFKNISDKNFPEESYNAACMKECAGKIMKLFVFEYKFDEKKVKSSQIIKFLRIALAKIDYGIHGKKNDSNYDYTIKYEGC